MKYLSYLLKSITVSLFLLCLFSVLPSCVFAQEDFYQADYDVVHTLQKDMSIETKLVVSLTNLRSDVYVTKFTLRIPSTADISDIKAISPSGEVTTDEQSDASATTLTFQFSQPVQGKQLSNLLEISFVQKNLVQKEGKTTEVLLPTFVSHNHPTRVTFDTVSLIDDSLSIAKPRPSSNEKTIVTWNSVKDAMIYLVFGQYQLYRAQLKYGLYNDRLLPVKQEVAFPPETLSQSVYVDSISPKPDEIYIDDDGNYIGRYVLSPQEKKNIVFNGVVKVYALDQDAMLPYVREQFNKQKKYLLTQQQYWNIDNTALLQRIEGLNSPEAVFSFVTNTLTYSYDRFSQNTTRIGAEGAWAHPTVAVCMEYTDLFIGVSREKGIFSREIQGYGYAKDTHLRPQSLQSDVLHAWPEFYDTGSQRWVQVDPTWNDTSGIDYLHGFDLSHIAFAIHGRNSVYPLPAGMYKHSQTKDVSIKAIPLEPEIKESLAVKLDFKEKINASEVAKGTITLTNTGNTFLKNLRLVLSSDSLTMSASVQSIGLVAPGQSMTIPVVYKTKPTSKQTGSLTVTIGSLYTNSVKFTILNQQTQFFLKAVKFTVAAVALIILLGLILRRV